MSKWLVSSFFSVFLSLASSQQPTSLARADTGHSAEVAKLMARAGQVAKDVAKLRGLSLKHEIARGVMTKEQVKERILAILDREYTPEELASESLAMKRLGLIPKDMDYVKVMVRLMQEQIAGFYDQHEKKLYIAGWAQAQVGGDMLMAHEIDHALQDQHFDLIKFMAPNKTNGDSVVARQALVEGDGTALMLEFQMAAMNQTPPWGNSMIMGMLKKGMEQGLSSMKGVPLALREGLLFPYLGGVEFIAYFRKNRGWKAIDAIYRKPPLSSEQILHPKKYEAYERPLVVRGASPKSLQGYKQKVSNVLGEKGVAMFLRSNGVSQERAVTAAAGWGGDRFQVFAPKGHRGSSPAGTVGVWLSAWDEGNDASEFFQALEHALPTLSGGTREGPAGGDASVLRFRGSHGLVVAERRAKQVLLTIGPPEKNTDNLRKDVWKRWRVSK